MVRAFRSPLRLSRYCYRDWTRYACYAYVLLAAIKFGLNMGYGDAAEAVASTAGEFTVQQSVSRFLFLTL